MEGEGRGREGGRERKEEKRIGKEGEEERKGEEEGIGGEGRRDYA